MESQIIDISATEKKYLRDRFFEAGVDNNTLPPAQDDSLFEILENIQPVFGGGLQRRWGYALFSNPALSTRKMYSFQRDSDTTGRIIISSTAGIKALNEDGSSWNSSLFTPVGTSQPRAQASRDYAYFYTGNTNDLKKWDGSNSSGVTNWGIATTAASAGTSGPNNPATASDSGGGASGWANPTNVFSSNDARATTTIVGSSSSSQGPLGGSSASQSSGAPGGTASWTNTGNLFASDDNRAGVSMSAGVASQNLKITGFGFSVPVGATINGIVVELETQSQINVVDNSILIVKGGTASGTDHSAGASLGGSDSFRSFGSSSDLWGLSWSASDINASNFGIQYSCINNAAALRTAAVDYVRITVYYSTTATVVRSNNLDVSNFSHTTSGTINGIKVEVEGSASTGSNTKLKATLLKAGAAAGTQKIGDFTVGETVVALGGATELWGATWTVSEINASTFGVQIYAEIQDGNTSNVAIDHVKITVYYLGGASVSTAAAGSITLTAGRSYAFVYQNPSTQATSDLTPFSTTTGAITSKQIDISNIPVPSDPQATRKLILATADGNDRSTLYLVGDIAAATTTFSDNMTETTLLTQPIYLETDEFGTEIGVADNTPPPNITLATKHRGRFYGVVGQNLYFTKNLDELVTSTGTVAGRWEECWPADNYLDISEGTEVPNAVLSDGEVLYIGTDRHIRRLLGDGPDNFQAPQVVFNNVGVLNQDVIKTVFLEGAPVGAIWVTPDLRVIGSDFNTYRDIGTPIQSTLDSVNTAQISKIHATFVSYKSFDLYVLALPTGASTECDTLCVYNLDNKQWFIWKPTDKVQAMLYNIDSTGASQFLFAADTNKLYQFKASEVQDRIADTPVSFSATIQTGWLPLGSSAMRKLLNEIDLLTDDGSLIVTVEGASTNAEFDSPSIVKSGVVTQSPLGDYKFYLAGSNATDRLYRLRFVSTGTSSNILDGYSLNFIPIHYS